MNTKNILKLFLFIWLFFTFIANIFAFDANLQLDKKETDINDYIKLRVEINSEEWWEIWITSIPWLDNFEIISQSQSQSSSTSIIVVDWKTQSKIKTSHNLDFTLKAKSKWDFIVWPVMLTKDEDKIKTNSVDIKVTGDNLFINNNHLDVQAKSWWASLDNTKKIETDNNQKDIEKSDAVIKKDFNDNKQVYLFIWVLFLLLLWFYVILKNNSKLLINKEKEKEDIEEAIDFDEKQVDVNYPEINDDDFINKITYIFKHKLQKKFKIKKIENKTFDEILDELNDKNEDIKIIISILNKSKYSNFIWDNNKLLLLVKNIEL